ncbi:MAG TPA: SUMF1/EgtB/PvdO family nonheme iron enzyme [Paludibacter sp.]|nr:SUMF1/EgtB/PvdO family nonheme iron enzyme [Paludibacter sp.]
MKKLKLFSFVLLVLLMTNCIPDPDDPDNPANSVFCEISDIDFTTVKDAKLIVVNTKLDWSIASSNDWIILTENKGKGKTGILVGVENNNSLPRKGRITISTTDSIHEIEIRQAGYHEISYTVSGVGVKLLLAPAGKFMMGTTGNNINSPLRQVKVDSFYICETEVTNALWRAVTSTLPYDTVKAASGLTLSKLDEEPVSYISWNDVQFFLTALNLKLGLQFRLPTEAEWQYAASGADKSKGNLYSGSNDLDEVGWYVDNSGKVKHPVKQLIPNELGLYDMSGNVYEWCNDWYKQYYGDWYGSSTTNFITVENPKGPETGTMKVKRGGYYNSLNVYWGGECAPNERGSLSPICFEITSPGTVHEKVVYRCESVGFRFILPVVK